MPVIFMERSLLDSLTEADIKEITQKFMRPTRGR